MGEKWPFSSNSDNDAHNETLWEGEVENDPSEWKSTILSCSFFLCRFFS